MAIDWGGAGEILGAAGAGLLGRGSEYLTDLEDRKLAEDERRRKLAEERQRTVFTDSYTALQMAEAGDFSGVVALGQERLEASKSFPEADFKDTKMLTEMATLAATGDKEAQRRLTSTLQRNVDLGRNLGILSSPKVVATKQVGNMLLTVTDDNKVTPHKIEGLDPNMIADAQFGGTELWKDSQGHFFYSTMVKNPMGGGGRSTRVPVFPEIYDGPPVGEVVPVQRSSGLTAPERVTQTGQEEDAKNQSRLDRETKKPIMEAGVQAKTMLPQLDNLIEIASQAETGGLASVRKKIGNFFRLGDEETVDLNRMENLLAEWTLARLQKLRPVTEEERKWVRSVSADLDAGTKPNIAMLRDLRDIQQRALNAARWLSKDPNRTINDYLLEDESVFAPNYQTHEDQGQAPGRQFMSTPVPGAPRGVQAPAAPAPIKILNRKREGQ